MDQLFASIRIKPVVIARREMMNLIHKEMNWSPGRIAQYFGQDISTVQHHLGLRKKSKVKYGALNDD
jgi:chromosomal replication initiation ATPase DnaA